MPKNTSDFYEIIHNQYFLCVNEIGKTKEEIVTVLKHTNQPYKCEVIDKACGQEVLLVDIGKAQRLQVLLYNYKVSSIFLDVYGGEYEFKGKRLGNVAIDTFLNLIYNEAIHYERFEQSTKECILKIEHLFVYFNTDLRYPLYKIGYQTRLM